MALHVDYIVVGPPVSNQSTGPNLLVWRGAVATAVGLAWNQGCLTGELKAVVVNFYGTPRPTLDLDNLSKPILDTMQRIVYNNDRQIVQAELTNVSIFAAFVVTGVRPMVVNAIHAGSDFVYVRIEDPV